ncbi:MAG TPA: gluconate:H+ symporter [Verrucomicrobiae bacterium]
MHSNIHLLLCAFVAVIGLIFLIARCKVHAFLALLLAALFVGLCCGMEPMKLARALQDGVGAVLRDIALVVGLGTVLGKLLADSGGARVIAETFLQLLGQRRLLLAMMLIGLLIGIPVFFAVGLVLLAPILFTLVRQTKMPLLSLGIPLLAGLSVAHGLVPPHPGPMAAIGNFNALAGKTDVGKTILYSLLIGFPTALVAGPLFAKWITPRVPLELSGDVAQQLIQEGPARHKSPGFGLALFTILLPVLIMLLKTLLDLTAPMENVVRHTFDFLGEAPVALLISVLVALYTFGLRIGHSAAELGKATAESLKPVAEILLVVGAGGGFNRVLVESGVGSAIADCTKGLPISPFLLGWLAAALFRVATGSATVAISAAAGLMAPIVSANPGLNRELLVVAMGAGSLTLSHLNDGGFWFVKEYFNMSVPQMLKTWTILETLISLVALALVFVLDAILRLAS